MALQGTWYWLIFAARSYITFNTNNPFAINSTTKEFNMQKLAGKVAVITGGSSGIGLAAAQKFIKEGAYVFITGRRETELAKAKAELGKNSRAVQGDVRISRTLTGSTQPSRLRKALWTLSSLARRS
jgi:3-oxoacyl-ACP reductase-like protein